MSERGKLWMILEALCSAQRYRDELRYRRRANGAFEPPEINMPTVLWHELVTAGEEHCKFSGADLRDDLDEDGGIDQLKRAFRAIFEFEDEEADRYSHNGTSYVPAQLSLPTEIWHEVCLLCDEFNMRDYLEPWSEEPSA